jgi:hypothetical protein
MLENSKCAGQNLAFDIHVAERVLSLRMSIPLCLNGCICSRMLQLLVVTNECPH